MLNAVSEGFDWVILDCTPMLPMADATSLSRLCDGVLVVVREGHTRKRTLNRALDSIEKSKQLGFIFNEASTVQIGYERYYGGYGYYGSKKTGGNEEAGTRSRGPCMIRLFNAYFPTRTLLLTLSEAILVTLASSWPCCYRPARPLDARIYLLYENGAGRIALVVLVFLILMYYFDLYDSSILTNRREVVTRLVGVLGCTFVALAVLYYTFPEASLGGYRPVERHHHDRRRGSGVAKLFFRAQSLRPFCRNHGNLWRWPARSAPHRGNLAAS